MHAAKARISPLDTSSAKVKSKSPCHIGSECRAQSWAKSPGHNQRRLQANFGCLAYQGTRLIHNHSGLQRHGSSYIAPSPPVTSKSEPSHRELGQVPRSQTGQTGRLQVRPSSPDQDQVPVISQGPPVTITARSLNMTSHI